MLSREGSLSSLTSGPSTLPIIPPIVTCERDRAFLTQLNDDIDAELEVIDPGSNGQRYACFRDAFDKVIDYVEAYKPVLAAVKAEYEECITKILISRQQTFYLRGKVKALATEPTTTSNYTRRGDELEQKLMIISNDNDRLRRQLADLKAVRMHNSHPLQAESQRSVTPLEKPTVDSRPIPDLTLQQATDVDVLKLSLGKLDRQLRELGIAQRTRYSPAQVRDHLKTQLHVKVQINDELGEQLEAMKAKRAKLKIAVEAAHAYLRIQPPHQSIGDTVITAIIRANKQETSKAGGEEGIAIGTPSTTLEEDDPTQKKESEMMLEYIEKFNELVEDGRVEEAALHAANSPKGILRTSETLNRFRDLTVRVSGGRSPMLAFCEALMATVPAFGVKPSHLVSHECVKCALQESRLDLLLHWISQDRLSLMEQEGRLIQQWCEGHAGVLGRRYLPVAQTVYMAVGAHVPAVCCLLQQGRFHQALQYMQAPAHFQVTDYVAVLYQCPSAPLVEAVCPSTGRLLAPLGLVLTTLLKTGSYEVGLKHLVKLSQDDNTTWLCDAVFADDITTLAEWQDVSARLQEHGHQEVALHLLAAVTTAFATRGATTAFKQLQEDVRGPGTHTAFPRDTTLQLARTVPAKDETLKDPSRAKAPTSIAPPKDETQKAPCRDKIVQPTDTAPPVDKTGTVPTEDGSPILQIREETHTAPPSDETHTAPHGGRTQIEPPGDEMLHPPTRKAKHMEVRDVELREQEDQEDQEDQEEPGSSGAKPCSSSSIRLSTNLEDIAGAQALSNRIEPSVPENPPPKEKTDTNHDPGPNNGLGSYPGYGPDPSPGPGHN